MNLDLKISALVGPLLVIAMLSSSQAQTAPAALQQKARRWVKEHTWSEGSKLQLSPATDAVTFYQQYQAQPELWKKVFRYLRDNNLESLAAGRYVIAGDSAYAVVTENQSKEPSQTKWESHREYIDLQYVIKGKEQIGILPVTQATIAAPYNAEKDNISYTATSGRHYTAEPGTFYLFFPSDAHRPNIKINGFDVVKKLVIKIKFFPN